MIEKIALRNYRHFRTLDLSFSSGTNILVGRNESGKSTVLEAILLALTGRVHGRPFGQELSPYFINRSATEEYLGLLAGRPGPPPSPPEIIIEVYFDESGETAELRGTNNLFGEDACGVRLQARLSPEYLEEYKSFVQEPADVRLAPTEYYRVEWFGFSGNAVTARDIPANAAVIDPSSIQLQSGVDFQMQQILRANLEPRERVELSRQYRSMREAFSTQERVKAINDRLRSADEGLSDRKLSLAIDLSQRYTWEGSLAAHLDDLPFELIGKGEQTTVKTLLALGRRSAGSHVVLIEEPESHLAFSALRALIARIEKACEGRQLIIATHSTYVLNKLGLENLILLGDAGPVRMADLPPETVEFFKKLAGFDTLRLVLADKVILVEGPSDELVIQRAYRDQHGKLPIEDGIDVMSVGLSHKRFLDLAVRLGRRVWAVTDNDGRAVAEVRERFKDYLDSPCVSVHTGGDPALNTLEPCLVGANELATLNKVFGQAFSSKEDVLAAMLADKTSAALAIFESPMSIKMPEYIRDVVTR